MRGSGILMHISSLPSNYGIGTFGQSAYEFVDFLKKSKVKMGNYHFFTAHKIGRPPGDTHWFR